MVDNTVDTRNHAGVLAIETSSDACSVAFGGADGATTEDHRELPRGHHRALLPMIEAMLAQRRVDPRALAAIVLGAGPGSFTGLRIGASVAMGLALAAACPIVAVSSLMVLAAGAYEGDLSTPGTTMIAAQPARPGELYVGVYRRGESGWSAVMADRVVSVGSLRDHLSEHSRGHAIVAGRGAASVLDAVLAQTWRRSPYELPRAAMALAIGLPLVRSGGGTDAAHLELNYVNDESAWRKA